VPERAESINLMPHYPSLFNHAMAELKFAMESGEDLDRTDAVTLLRAAGRAMLTCYDEHGQFSSKQFVVLRDYLCDLPTP
jgi:hypothetical protein